jgi:hypothetical protein
LIFHLCRGINIAAMVGVLCERTQIMECARTTLHSKHGFTPNTSTYLLTGESLRMKKKHRKVIFLFTAQKKSNLDLDRLSSFVSDIKQLLTKTKKQLRQAPNLDRLAGQPIQIFHKNTKETPCKQSGLAKKNLSKKKNR